MPETSQTYQKTAKGGQAIATREHGLPPKLRSMLILVDGKRTVADLAKLAAMLGDTRELLARLESEGFIQPVGGQVAAPPAATADTGAVPSVPVTPTAPTSTTVTLAEAKRFAVRRLNDLLGPSAESLCLRIEAAKTPHEFLQHVAKAEDVLRSFGGARMADAFSQEMQSRRPG